MISPGDEKRALQMYELARALVQVQGAPITLGFGMVREFRVGHLTIHYLPKSGHLDLWRRRKVLTIDRWGGKLQVTRYLPGYWEDELEEAAAKSPSKSRLAPS